MNTPVSLLFSLKWLSLPTVPCVSQHHSYRSFLGLTCLMQISTRTEDFIIDALELRSEMYILNESLTNPAIVKVSQPCPTRAWECRLQEDFFGAPCSGLVAKVPHPGRQQECLGPCHPQRTPSLNLQLLALVWPSPGFEGTQGEN